MTTKVIRRSRKYLNPINYYDTGILQSRVESSEDGIDCTLMIWDCNRKIDLNFSVWDEQDAKVRSNKLDILIKELTELKEAMGKGYDYYQEQKEKNSEHSE